MMEAPLGVKVVLRDGRAFYGPIYFWRPAEGWFSLVIDSLYYPDAPDVFWLRDCASAVDRQQRVRIDLQADVDLLERARREGWDGK